MRKTRYTTSLYEHMSDSIEKKALELLEDGVDTGCLLYIDGFSNRSVFERMIIKIGRDRKLTILLNKNTKRIEFLRKEKGYKHIHNPETLKANSSKWTPKKVIIADNVTFKSIEDLEEKYELVGGFRNEYRDEKEHEKEIDEMLRAMYEEE
ncbi:hypothetical protein [Paenibacillus odorifer]|uniref:hypothetical protein n=1 Tax=Paenibacillus odorifer TaxID=189426 RepID=UPI00096D1456|nr:hypothetical protein [Paenibacillus odorifer]OMD75305.1 hypothetical protein BSK50_19080 [Paenibacillus odorifer]